MSNVKLSQITSGGAFVAATDNIVTVRNGNTDVLTTITNPSANVNSVSGDGTYITNSGSTGAVTLTTAFGTAALKNTGTSGATVPLLNGANTWSGTNNFTSTFEISGTTENFPASGNLVGTTDTQTLTNKKITKRVTTASNAASITPNTDTADITYQANTQSAGTLTINADSGTSQTEGQSWLLKINSTNVQTFSWNAVYAGGTNALPTATTGSSKTDYFTFIWDSVNSVWRFTGQALGF